MFTSALHPERGERREDLTDERCIEQIRIAVGVPDLNVSILPAYPWDAVKVGLWELTALYAEQYQRGRVFLAGDSAHTILPTGAMGASTGIQDAFNLAWKMLSTCYGDAREKASSATPRKNTRLIAGCNASLYTTVKNQSVSERTNRKHYAVLQPLAPTRSLELAGGNVPRVCR